MTLDEPVDAQNPLAAAEPLTTVVLRPGGTARVRQIAGRAAWPMFPLTQIPEFLTIRPRAWLRPMTLIAGVVTCRHGVHPEAGCPPRKSCNGGRVRPPLPGIPRLRAPRHTRSPNTTDGRGTCRREHERQYAKR